MLGRMNAGQERKVLVILKADGTARIQYTENTTVGDVAVASGVLMRDAMLMHVRGGGCLDEARDTIWDLLNTVALDAEQELREGEGGERELEG